MTDSYAFVNVRIHIGIVMTLEQANAEEKIWGNFRIAEADGNSDKSQAATLTSAWRRSTSC